MGVGVLSDGRGPRLRRERAVVREAQPSWGWNERNKDKAKKLMQEAGYKGEPIRFVTTQEYKWMYDFALVTSSSSRTSGSTSTSRSWTGRRS